MIFGTQEWSVASMNCFKGCENSCAYCYAQANFSRYDKDFVKVKDKPVAKDWTAFANDFKTKCRKNRGVGKVMFPSVHDITPVTQDYCIKALKHMIEFENNHFEFLVVSKPRKECINKLCQELKGYKERILFRFTIGSADDKVLKLWEPNAPSFQERVDCVKYAYENGFRTSISCEPMLDGNVGAVIEAVYAYVTDAIWLGTVNSMKFRLKMNGADDELHLKGAEKLQELGREDKAIELYARWGKDKKIKWKESLKTVLRLPMSDGVGADV